MASVRAAPAMKSLYTPSLNVERAVPVETLKSHCAHHARHRELTQRRLVCWLLATEPSQGEGGDAPPNAAPDNRQEDVQAIPLRSEVAENVDDEGEDQGHDADDDAVESGPRAWVDRQELRGYPHRARHDQQRDDRSHAHDGPPRRDPPGPGGAPAGDHVPKAGGPHPPQPTGGAPPPTCAQAAPPPPSRRRTKHILPDRPNHPPR